jgi:rubrerythrin
MGKVSEFLFEIIEAVIIVFKEYNYENNKPTHKMVDMDRFINEHFPEIYDNMYTRFSEKFTQGFYDENKEFIIQEIMSELAESEQNTNESLEMPSLEEYVKYPGKYKFDLDEDNLEDRIKREREFNRSPRYAGGYTTPPPAKDYKSQTKSTVDKYDYNERKFISTNIKAKQDLLGNMGYDLETGEEDPTKAPTTKELNKLNIAKKLLLRKKKSTTSEKKTEKNIRTFLNKIEPNKGKFNVLKKELGGKEKEMSKFIKKHRRESVLDNKNEIIMSSLFELDKDSLNYDELNSKKNKIYKRKYQCNKCGHIGYELTCPKCGHGMFPYKNKI